MDFYRILFSLLLMIFILSLFKKESLGREQGMKRGAVDYFIEMDDARLKDFIKSVKRIALGDTVQKVKAILGNPTYDDNLIGKRGEFVARALAYYVRKLRDNTVNIREDKLVTFYFDKNGILTKIASNVDGLTYKNLSVQN